jgi:hypothetical protein
MEECLNNLLQQITRANEMSDQLAARLEQKVDEVAEVAAKRLKLAADKEFKSRRRK